MKQNITLSLDTHLLQQAKELAARRHMSVSRLLAEDLAVQVSEDRHYEQAMRQALNWLDRPALQLEGQYLSRDDVHAR